MSRVPDKTIRRAGVALVVLAAQAVSLPYGGTARAQERPKLPTFPSQVELITVDAVVVDKDGRPVPGLTKDDFVVKEDGRAQEIASFEPFVLEPPDAPVEPPAVATNEPATRPRQRPRLLAPGGRRADRAGADRGRARGRRVVPGALGPRRRPRDLADVERRRLLDRPRARGHRRPDRGGLAHQGPRHPAAVRRQHERIRGLPDRQPRRFAGHGRGRAGRSHGRGVGKGAGPAALGIGDRGHRPRGDEAAGEDALAERPPLHPQQLRLPRARAGHGDRRPAPDAPGRHPRRRAP